MKPTSIQTRLLLGLFALMIVLVSVTGLLVVHNTREVLARADRNRARAVVQQLASNLSFALLSGDRQLIADGVAGALQNPDMVEIVVFDTQGVEQYRAGGLTALPAKEAQFEVRSRVVQASPGGADDELELFGIGSPRNESVGSISASFSSRASEDALDALYLRLLWALLGATVLGAAGSVFLGRSISNRLRRLARAADTVASGDLESVPNQTEGGGRDEISHLANSFERMTQALREQRAALEDASEQLAERESLAAIGRTTAVIAHEIKNPLGILMGAADVAANPRRTERERDEAISIIRDETKRLEGSLEALLAYARPQQPEPSTIPLRAHLLNLIQRFELHSEAAAMNTTVVGESVLVSFDGEHLRRICLNLLKNGQQAGAHEFRFTIEATNTTVTVLAQDDGPGVKETLGGELFKPFVTTKQRGAGLGLAGSRQLARNNRGNLEYLGTSTLGGALFSLTLPRSPG